MGLLSFSLFCGWAFGAYRFFRGYNRTSYEPGFKAPLAALWPVLVVVNKNYRSQFTRSIKASDDF